MVLAVLAWHKSFTNLACADSLPTFKPPPGLARHLVPEAVLGELRCYENKSQDWQTKKVQCAKLLYAHTDTQTEAPSPTMASVSSALA